MPYYKNPGEQKKACAHDGGDRIRYIPLQNLAHMSVTQPDIPDTNYLLNL